MLLKQLLQIAEASAEKYVLALISGKDSSIKGYFVDDASTVSKKVAKACSYTSKSSAAKDAKECNARWDLNGGDKFEVRDLKTITEDVQIAEEYNTSIEFDNDIQKIQQHLQDALAIMNTANFAKHIDDTESNFSVAGLRESHDKLYEAIDSAINDASDFYDTMGEAA